MALREFAIHTGVAFLPYLEKSYENVYKMIDHPQEDIRKASIEALTSFIIAIMKQGNTQGVANVVTNFIPKLGTIVRDDEDCTVVMSALDAFAELLKELKELAIPTEDLRDTIFTCINDVMLGKVACQFNDPIEKGAGDEDQEESEYDEAIIEAAGNILPLFGKAMHVDMFAMLFGRIFPVIIKKIVSLLFSKFHRHILKLYIFYSKNHSIRKKCLPKDPLVSDVWPNVSLLYKTTQANISAQ